jgi:hypothetical protein
LLSRTRAVLAVADVFYLLADKLSALRTWRLALQSILMRTFDDFHLWHERSLSFTDWHPTPPISIEK